MLHLVCEARNDRRRGKSDLFTDAFVPRGALYVKYFDISIINDVMRFFCLTESGPGQDVAVKKSSMKVNISHNHHCHAAKHEGISSEGTRLTAPRLPLEK